MNVTKRVLIWDLPTRLFHWMFACGFGVAAVIALVLGEHHPLFPHHALAGLTIACLLIMRVVWGLVGTRYARFGSFAFGSGPVIAYFRGFRSGEGVRAIGHNPGAAWAIFAMLALVAGLAVTGLLLGTGREAVEDLHSILAYALLVIVTLHILGVVVHTIRHRDNIIASMIHGSKEVGEAEAIRSAHPGVALVFLIVAGAWAGALWANYDAATRTTRLPLAGVTLQIGEEEHEAELEAPGSQEEDGD
jgi:cytochrome b